MILRCKRQVPPWASQQNKPNPHKTRQACSGPTVLGQLSGHSHRLREGRRENLSSVLVEGWELDGGEGIPGSRNGSDQGVQVEKEGELQRERRLLPLWRPLTNNCLILFSPLLHLRKEAGQRPFTPTKPSPFPQCQVRIKIQSSPAVMVQPQSLANIAGI